MKSRTGATAALAVIFLASGAAIGSRWILPALEGSPDDSFSLSSGVRYYSVAPEGEPIGFASSTVDSTASGVQVSDYFLADLQTEGESYRAWARVVARLTRDLELREFVLTLSPEIGPLRAAGTVQGDTLLTLSVALGANARPDTQFISIPPGTLLPNIVPLAMARPDGPQVGESRTFSVFDPMAMAPKTVQAHILAESLFVVADSATRDAATGRWQSAGMDTIRAWRIEGEGVVSGWIDRQGRLVEGTLLGLVPLRRTAYALAYDAWNDGTKNKTISSSRDIQETTAIAASVPIEDKRRVSLLRVVLRGAALEGYDLNGARQSLAGDTLAVRRADSSDLVAAYEIGDAPDSVAQWLEPEPLVQSDAPEIVALAQRIAGEEKDPSRVARQLVAWVYDSLEKRISFSIPDARAVLRLRAGDCNEHTQLYVALARAAGIPARTVAGLTSVRGKFYYHAWPEIYLNGWVPVDPTFGQFPADAAHLRFVIGGFTRQAELLRLIGALQIDVVQAER